MRNLILLLLCSTLVGCAAVPAKPNLPSYTFNPAWDQSQRQYIYEHMKVSQTRARSAVVGNQTLDRDSLLQLYRDNKAKEALGQAQESRISDLMAVAVPSATVAAGTVIGWAIGGVFYYFSGYQEVQDAGGTFIVSTPRKGADLREGALAGLAVGGAIALIEIPVFLSVSQRHFNKSTQLYNQALESNLKLTLSPLPGGAKAGVDMRF